MDASNDDQDVLLQKTSPELLAELQKSLRPFLWKTKKSGLHQIRENVRVKETERLVNLLEPFQELPQLLDPHLSHLVPILADAFLDFLRASPPTTPSPATQLLIPLSRAICRLLYTLCKIRGEKVIVRFLSTEMRHLELLLYALELGKASKQDDGSRFAWDWEERYIALLWLSQLLLAPFDLSTISSEYTDRASPPSIAGLVWPFSTPGITFRVISLAVLYLSSSGKERDAAKVLLVRVSMRRDMQELGILQALVQWSLSCLNTHALEQNSSYLQIGILSFLAGLLSSSTSTRDMQPYLSPIFESVQAISANNPSFKALHSLALARKMVIKVLRTLSVIVLQVSGNVENSDIVESTISSLLESLTDPATPVRLAASKALSMITLKLDPELAAQVIDAVLDALRVNVTWKSDDDSNKQYDISRVNPYEWHGSILTLSHLLYRHSPPASSLPDILSALFLGLSFEQKSTTGASIGSNVRDAACFGIWALARRYTTRELQMISLPQSESRTEPEKDRNVSTLQQLATLLVVSACLDPAGNIRRGSSAALQELIGRHPNTIEEGISVVQVVDYHAIALRSRSIREVVINVAQRSDFYHSSLAIHLLGWRGIQDSNSAVRQDAASTIGALTWAKAFEMDVLTGGTKFNSTLMNISDRLGRLAIRETELRHGLLLCLGSLIEHMRTDMIEPQEKSRICADTDDTRAAILRVLKEVTGILEATASSFSQYRSPELIAAAAGRLISASLPVVRKEYEMQYKTHLHDSKTGHVTGLPPPNPSLAEIGHCISRMVPSPSLSVGAPQFDARGVLHDLDLIYTGSLLPNVAFVSMAWKLLDLLMPFDDSACVDFVADAAADLLLLSPKRMRQHYCKEWLHEAEVRGRSSTNLGKSYLYSLFRILPLVAILPDAVSDVVSVVKKRWTTRRIVEGRIAILHCLSKCPDLAIYLQDFVDIILEGLDDYTTDARGDVGSLVRIEGLKVVRALWQQGEKTISLNSDTMSKLYGRVLRLSAEKLDKVRAEGQAALSYLLLDLQVAKSFSDLSTSSPQYFTSLLALTLPKSSHLPKTFSSSSDDILLPQLLSGYVTSADTGSEDLVRSSRSALAAFCGVPQNSRAVVTALSGIIKASDGDDRVLVPTMEVIGYLNDIGAWEGVTLESLKLLFLRTQKAHYKTTNVKKLDAAIKIYGCIIEALSPPSSPTEDLGSNELLTKVIEKLTGMLSHPFPRVREKVIEDLWVRSGVGKRMDVTKKGVGKDELRQIRDLIMS